MYNIYNERCTGMKAHTVTFTFPGALQWYTYTYSLRTTDRMEKGANQISSLMVVSSPFFQKSMQVVFLINKYIKDNSASSN